MAEPKHGVPREESSRATEPFRRRRGIGPIVGRRAELAQLGEAVERSDLLTLVGPPGAGKTRLAEEIALQCSASGTRVLFVELADARDDTDLYPTLAQAAAGLLLCTPPIARGEGVDGFAGLGAFLRDQGIGLIVLDNFEHLVETCAAMVGSLAETFNAAIVTTSRQRLGLPSEACLHVPYLPTPPEGSTESPAVDLFYERAERIHPGAGSIPREAVATLVRSLEGNPLALSLCAPRVALLGAAALEEPVFAAPSLAGPRSGLRFASIDAAISWSVERLSGRERGALASLAAFPSAFNLEGATTVLACTTDEALGILTSLCERSLLTSQGTKRPWRLYAGVREYVAKHHPSPEALQRHGDWVVQAEATLPWSPPSTAAVCTGELLAVLARIRRDEVPGGTDRAARVALQLSNSFLCHGPLTAFRDLLLEILGEKPSDALRADLLATLGEVEVKRGRFDAAQAAWVGAADGPSITESDRAREAFLEVSLGGLAAIRFEPETARTHFHAAAEKLTRLSDPRYLEAKLKSERAIIESLDPASPAEVSLEQATWFFQESDDAAAGAYAAGRLAFTRFAMGSLREARRSLEGAQALAERAKDERWLAMLELLEAAIAWMDAESHLFDAPRLSRSLAAFEKLELPWAVALAHLAIAEGALLEGDAELAAEHAAAALARARPIGAQHATLHALSVLAVSAARLGDLAEAQLHFDRAEAVSQKIAAPLFAEALALRRLELELSSAGHAAIEERLSAVDDEPHLAVRLVARSIRRRLALEQPQSRALVWSNGVLTRDEHRIDLSRKPRLRAIAEALLEAHRRAPEEWLTIEDVFSAGWPGERIRRASLTNRVHVSLSRLRKLGFEAMLESDPVAGYRIAPEVSIAEE